MATNKNIISLSPEKAVSYCEIVLSELALCESKSTIISSTYINFGFSGISMPNIQLRRSVNLEIYPPMNPTIIIESPFSLDQLKFIEGLIKNNRDSSMFRYAKLLLHYRRRISRILNSRELQRRQSAWLHDPVNKGVDVQYSPRVIAENRLYKWTKRASDKSLPGIVGKCYTEYLDSVYARLA